jgi:hypothetical protein
MGGTARVSERQSRLSKGSRPSLSPVDVQSISQPRRSSRSSLSAFQTGVRGSNVEVPHPDEVNNTRPYLIAVILLLLCTVGVLILLLLI